MAGSSTNGKYESDEENKGGRHMSEVKSPYDLEPTDRHPRHAERECP